MLQIGVQISDQGQNGIQISDRGLAALLVVTAPYRSVLCRWVALRSLTRLIPAASAVAVEELGPRVLCTGKPGETCCKKCALETSL